MSFKFIRGDITEMTVDAIVNTANFLPIHSTGTDSAIYRKAGPKLIEARKKIGFISRGEVAITDGYNLPSKYIIHAVGTSWHGGTENDIKILRKCYKNSIQCAMDNHCKSLAIPLIGTGNFNFPREVSMKIAIQECIEFLLKNSNYDLTIYLVVFDPLSVRMAELIVGKFPHNMDNKDFFHKITTEYKFRKEGKTFIPSNLSLQPELQHDQYNRNPLRNRSLQEILLDERAQKSSGENPTLRAALQYFMDQSQIRPNELYNAIGMSCQTFMNIYDKGKVPKKENLRKLAIGLQLDLEEAKYLFSQAGYALNANNPEDEILIACCRNHFFDLYQIDVALEQAVGKSYFSIK